MTSKEFVDKYQGRNLDSYELAELTRDEVDPNEKLWSDACEYLHVTCAFLDCLEDNGYEW